MKTRKLKMAITEEERNARGRQAAELLYKAKVLEAEVEAFAKPRKAKIKDLLEEAAPLAEASATGWILEDIEVEEVVDFRQNSISIRRKDTGEIVEGPRAMTAAEREREPLLDASMIDDDEDTEADGPSEFAPTPAAALGKGKGRKPKPGAPLPN